MEEVRPYQHKETLKGGGHVRQRVWQHAFPLLILTVVAVWLNVRHLGEPPVYIHGWAQADNYSLALGFTHNGMNLLHPQTLIFNKQQFGFDDEPSLITSCDLPLHHWLVALAMKITGCRSAWVFRGFTLLVTLLGLWALYFLSFLLSRSRARALLASALVATAPAFTYYSAGFLPTAPALALAFAAGLAYVVHVQRDNSTALWVAVALLTLATMQRTSLAVLWVAVAAFQLWRVLRREVRLLPSLLPFVVGGALFVAWQLWGAVLRARFGSLFLGSLMPAHSFDEAKGVLDYAYHKWRFEYFSQIQYIVIALLAVLVLVLAVMGKNRKRAVGGLSPWWLLAILTVGELMFAVAMLRQYHDHDYYFLDSLFLPVVMLLVLLIAELPTLNSKMLRLGQWGVVGVLVVAMAVGANHVQHNRRAHNQDDLPTAIRYKAANAWLDSVGYGDATLRFVTLFSYSQNLPFCMMDREGYAVMWNDTAVVNHVLAMDYDYVLVEDAVYRQMFDEAQYILPRLQRVVGNGELSLCTVADSVLHPDADHFFAAR